MLFYSILYFLVECEANPEVSIETPWVPDFQSKIKRANLKSLPASLRRSILIEMKGGRKEVRAETPNRAH